jgi:transposase
LRIESPLRLVLRWPGKSVTTVTGKDTKVMPIISHLMGITLSQSEEKTPGTRMGRPNYARELRETPGGSGLRAVRISRETGARERHQREHAVHLAAAISGRASSACWTHPGRTGKRHASEVIASSPVEPQAQDTKPVSLAGTIEIRIGRAVVKVDGLVDADMLRIVLGSLRS